MNHLQRTRKCAQGWAVAYFGDAGGPERLNEPIYPLQNRRRTQGSQSSEHDEGQHLPRRKETVLGKMAQDQKKQAPGKSRDSGPNTWRSSPNLSTNSHSGPCQSLVTPTTPTALGCPEETRIRRGIREEAVLKLRRLLGQAGTAQE